MSPRPFQKQDDGFVLLALIVAIFLILLALSVAAPTMAKELQREREVETAHRAQQYTRAIELYYKKTQTYPTSIAALEKTVNQRYLRQQYVDPLTGKADWRLIHVGENKTAVKGFFGQDLPGLAPGLGSASGMGSAGGTGATLGAAASSASSTTNTSIPGSTTFGSSGSSGSGSSGLPGCGGGGIGPIMGIGTGTTGNAILVQNEQKTYQEWEFLYDPRVELLKAQVSIFGGGVATGGATGGTLGGATPGISGISTGTSAISSGFGSSSTAPTPATPTSPTPPATDGSTTPPPPAATTPPPL